MNCFFLTLTLFIYLFPNTLDSHSKTYVPLNLDRLQHWIDRGLIDPSQPITTKELLDSRCIHSVKDGVKILGDVSLPMRNDFERRKDKTKEAFFLSIFLLAPCLLLDLSLGFWLFHLERSKEEPKPSWIPMLEHSWSKFLFPILSLLSLLFLSIQGSKHLSQPISILVSKASTSAIQAIESLGGSITCRYYTPLTLRALTKPHKWTDLGRIVPRGSDPTGKRDLREWYGLIFTPVLYFRIYDLDFSFVDTIRKLDDKCWSRIGCLPLFLALLLTLEPLSLLHLPNLQSTIQTLEREVI